MSGFLILLQPLTDYHCAPDIWLICGIDNEPRRKKFQEHFHNALLAAKQKQPTDWTLDDVLRSMQKRWDITVLPAAVNVCY